MSIFINDIFYNYKEYDTIPSDPFHFLCIRQDGVLKVAINGIFSNTTYNMNDKILFNTIPLYIGYQPDTLSNKYFIGSLEDYCIISGKALWTENFTPPTTYLPDEIQI